MRLKDLTGQKFGRLTVKYRGENDNSNKAQWWCECECGNPDLILARGSDMLSEKVLSCGCLQKENARIAGKKNKKYNKYDLSGEYGIGWTSKGEEFYFDLEDYDKIKDYCWYKYTHKSGYSQLRTSDGTVMHQLVSGKKYQDHINRNAFDNRKSNLRDASRSQNNMNRGTNKNNKSGITGVYKHSKDKNCWCSCIRINGKQTHLYYGTSFEEAVKARLQAEKEYYGEFAPQQHLYKQYGIA
jgi:hypothetical protein